MADKHQKILKEQAGLFELHLSRVPKKKTTSRGKRFWRHPPTRDRLVEDTQNGNACIMKTTDLWVSREEYKDFSLEDFQKHIYQ